MVLATVGRRIGWGVGEFFRLRSLSRAAWHKLAPAPQPLPTMPASAGNPRFGTHLKLASFKGKVPVLRWGNSLALVGPGDGLCACGYPVGLVVAAVAVALMAQGSAQVCLVVPRKLA
jgi:hypothetical protein